MGIYNYCIYKLEDIKNFKFDETFDSYLEDLDFSLNLMKKKKIYISSEAKFLHPENIDRVVLNLELLRLEIG